MPCPDAGPCEDWVTSDDLCCLDEGELPGTCVANQPVTQAQLDLAIASASYVLWALSGRRFGVCEITVRPCSRECLGQGGPLYVPWASFYSSGFVVPYLFRGAWYNLSCGCQSECSCTELCEVTLPSPLCEVSQVKLDGVVMDPAAYRCDDWRKLVRIDGGCWPLCQDMDKDDDQPNTWSVTAQFGLEVPAMGKLAAAELACEFLKGCVGVECALPQRVTTLTRQGVSATFFDPQDFLANGKTGIYNVDLFLTASNPYGLAARPTVWSPDVRKPRVTGTCT